MSIRIEPDPSRPDGGRAILTADASAGTEGYLSFFDLTAERWLGPDGWQSAEVKLGPFTGEPDGAGGVRLTLGPKIVDEIEAYTALDVAFGSARARISWPDTILPSPPGASGGGLVVERKTAPKVAPPPLPKPPAPDPEPVVEEPAPAEGDAEEDPKSRLPVFLALLAVLLAVGGAVAWFLMSDTGGEERVVDCSEAGFAARAGEAFADQYEALTACGGDVTGPDLLRILETGAREEDGRALLRLGELYDPAMEADGPLVFSSRDPVLAAEYYNRAVAAGSAEAGERLDAICAVLDPGDAMQEFALSRYCGE
ncbi:MAG: hypothetical protein ACPGID_08880 [Rubricella sp.]